MGARKNSQIRSHRCTQIGEQPYFLTDGGIYDNLGIDRLMWYHWRKDRNLNRFLVSDAGGAFDWQLDKTYTFIMSRNIRASDLLMKRVTELEYGQLGPKDNPLFVRIKMSLTAFDAPGLALLTGLVQITRKADGSLM